MQTEDIRQIAAWLAATDIDVLELRGPDVEVKIQRDGAASVEMAPALEAAEPPQQDAVRAPSLGVLLDHIPGRAAPLCSPGAAVQAGDLIALLRVGALLLPVRSTCSGWASDWCVPPGSTVGYGTTLLHIDTETVAATAAES